MINKHTKKPVKKLAGRRKFATFFRGLGRGRFLARFKRFLEMTLRVPQGATLTQIWLSLWENWVNSKGEVFAAKRAKQYYDLCLRFTAGQIIDPIPFCKSSKDFFPTELHKFRPLLSGSLTERRAALHILGLWRLVNIEAPYSLSSITDKGILETPSPQSQVPIGNYFEKYINKFGPTIDGIDLIRFRDCWLSELEDAFPSESQKERVVAMSKLCGYHLSSKNGPNGPCLASISIDRIGLKSQPILEVAIQNMLKLTTNPGLKIYDAAGNVAFSSTVPGDVPLTSRLSVKIEPGAKARVFAICDYWTQTALTGIHSWNYKWLSKQPEDGTMSHNKVAEVARSWTSAPPLDDMEVWTKDLSTATDRLPRLLQQEVAQQQWGQTIGSLWSTIIGERDFQVPNGSEKVRYAVGQPMGALSSWSYLAITHHLIHRAIIRYNGYSRKDGIVRYLVIGDDEANLGTLHTNVYQTIMVKVLGVPISESKSFKGRAPKQGTASGLKFDTEHVYNERSKYEGYRSLDERQLIQSMHSCEIAKRVFINGHEVTPVPPKALQEGFESPIGFPSLLKQLWDREEFQPNSLGPLPSLASLSDKPKLAILLSAFPLTCAPPFRRVTQVYRECSKLDTYSRSDRDFGDAVTESISWYDYKYKSVEHAASQEMRKRLIKGILDAQKLAKEYLKFSKESNSEPIKIGARWMVERQGVCSLLHAVADNAIAIAKKKGILGIPLKSNLSFTELVEWTTQSHDLLSLDLALKGKARFREEKRNTQKALAQIQRDVLKRLSD